MKVKNPAKPLDITTAIIPPEDVELMVEPKRSCGRCYARGYELFLIEDGYKFETKQIPRLQTGIGDLVKYDEVTVKVENLKRVSRPCPCTFRHARFKLRAAAAKAKLAKKPKKIDSASLSSAPPQE